jgi:hypothetical protein
MFRAKRPLGEVKHEPMGMLLPMPSVLPWIEQEKALRLPLLGD